jgi:hypothetical protein
VQSRRGKIISRNIRVKLAQFELKPHLKPQII